MTDHSEHKNNEIQQLLDYRKFANDAAVNTGAAALKGLMIINGGAAIAMLGFLASLAGIADPDRFSALFSTGPIISFSLGAGAAVTAMGQSYFVNTMHAGLSDRFVDYVNSDFNAKNYPKKFSGFVRVFHISTVVTAAASLGLFLNGVWAISVLADKSF